LYLKNYIYFIQVSMQCNQCNQSEMVVRAGYIRGRQRYYCKACGTHFSEPLPASQLSIRRHQVTIIDIARELNLSKSTVSRALRGHPDINVQTKKAVLELAGQLDYQPNLLASSLVRSRSNTIGIIVPEFINQFFPAVIMGAQEVLEAAGYHVMICHSNESYLTEVANTRVLFASRVDGLLVSLTRETANTEHFENLQRKGVPLVFFNRVCEGMNVSKVMVDDYQGAYVAVEHLIAGGRKRIAHLAGPPALLISRNRLNGYLDALRAHNLPADPELIIHYDLTKEKARIYVKHLLDLSPPPDALFAINDPTAIEAIRVIKARGLRIPEDISVVGFSNDPSSELIEPGLTTVEQPVHQIGQVAAQLLLAQLESGSEAFVPQTRVLPTRLIVRGSTSAR
jgi:DNA-binding LacI/PurR family transcriptional regulator